MSVPVMSSPRTLERRQKGRARVALDGGAVARHGVAAMATGNGGFGDGDGLPTMRVAAAVSVGGVRRMSTQTLARSGTT